MTCLVAQRAAASGNDRVNVFEGERKKCVSDLCSGAAQPPGAPCQMNRVALHRDGGTGADFMRAPLTPTTCASSPHLLFP